MAAPKDRFWAKVLFRDFIRHYRKMTPEERAEDIEKSMDALEDLDENGSSFGSKMVFWATHRAENYPQASENGKKGGRPRKDKESTAVAPSREDGVNLDGTHTPTKAEAGTPVKHSFAYAGRGGNVNLTDDEYAMLLRELGNKRKADKLIDSLDYSISEGNTYNAPHFHVLMHWNDYREEKAAEAAEMAKVNADARAEAYSKRGYKTAEERQQEELAKINDFCTGLRNGTIKIVKEV